MDRYFQTFQTQKERTKWIREMQKKHPRFHVCCNEPTNGRDMPIYRMNGIDTNVMKYACVYCFREE